MADDNNQLLDYILDSQPESNNYGQEDFENIEPNAGFESGGTIHEQDEDAVTTTYAGEEPAEEDRYAAGASEAEAIETSKPFWGDDDLSAPVPDSQSADNDLGFFGTNTFTGLQSDFKSSTPPIPAFQDPFTFHSHQSEVVSSTEALQEPKSEAVWLKNVDPRVLDLIYWRDVRKTGVVFGSMMLILMSLAFFSLLSVLAYLSLAILTVTLSFRVYKNIMAAVQKTNEGHPFKLYLELDITLKEEKVSRVTQSILQHINRSLLELRRLFLIEDLVDSIKFGLLLWVLTYLGAWFNGMTLIILAVVAVFTIPKIYETYKVQIDNYLNLARTQLNGIITQIQSKVPFLKKKAKTQ